MKMKNPPAREVPRDGSRVCLRALASLTLALLWLSGVAAPPLVLGRTDDASREWVYTLLPGSALTQECPRCAIRKPIVEPLRGTFRLRWLEETPLFTRYELRDISFTAGAAPGPVYRVTGHGAYQVGGEVAFLQELSLQVEIHNGASTTLAQLESGFRPVDRLWPILQITIDQTNGTPVQVYHLNLVAAPLRDIWFSTGHGLTPANWKPPTNHVSAGDLLSVTGQVVRSNAGLTRNLGIMPSTDPPDLGLDAVGVLPNGEILFSLKRDVFSETLGPLQHGDLLAARGRLVRRNQDLYAAFSPMPSRCPPDVGLDAVQVLPDGEIYFSIETNLFSEGLGVMLRPGDLLSSRGQIIKSNRQLLARFHPPPNSGPETRDYGLDALYVWPGSEIWFSLEEGFQDANLGPVRPGDLLSDQGFVVYHNLDLLNAFSPLEDLADFGLDALHMVSGAIPPPPPTNGVWRYALLEGSHLIDDCLICGRPTIEVPLRGSFGLRLIEENSLFARYAMEDIAFVAGSPAGLSYTVTGHGTYQVGGEVALRQELFLEACIDDGRTYQLGFFTNEVATVDRLWPMIHVTLGQTNGTLLQTFELELAAAPLREIWFSTPHGLHAGIWQSPTNYVSSGDLLSSAGRIVKRNHELTARLGVMPIVPDLGLDAVDILPGGEIAFSVEQDIFSESLGPLHHGDLLSNRGRVVKRNQELTAAFAPMPPVPDLGLDAVQVLDNGDVYFSLEKELFSERLGRMLRSGDLLSSRGTIVKSNEQLLARFQPADPKLDYGLDALFVWPSGEVWFSVEKGFQGQHFEFYNDGDLLSDQGYVVYRNLELVGPFAPLEDLADFGLDALFIITDVTPPAPPPQIMRLERHRLTGVAHIEWEGKGRVWQVRGTGIVTGPFAPRSSIVPDLSFDDAAVATDPAEFFYRLQQW